MDRIKTVFHVHTDHSDDCSSSVPRLLELARERGVGCVAVTDHDTIMGAREAARLAGAELKVIIGEEISTTGGHLIGLFLREEIEPGLSPRQTAVAIKDQGGLVVVPHPFNWMFGCGLRGHVKEIIDLIDIVEVSNAQNLSSVPNRRAERFALRHDFPRIVGVDLHFGETLDACYQQLEPFDGPAGFLSALGRAALVKGRHPLSYFFRTAWYVFLDRSGISQPEGFGANARRRRLRFPRTLFASGFSARS